MPHQWYFTSKAGQVCRKYSYNLTVSNVRAALESKYAATDIVGVGYEYACEGKGDIVVTSEYIDKDGLGTFRCETIEEYLSAGKNKDMRILQGFVAPQGHYNCTLGVSNGSPHIGVVVALRRAMLCGEEDKCQRDCQPKSQLPGPRGDLRRPREHGPNEYARTASARVENFVSNLLQSKITDACKRIGDYIFSVTNKQFSVKRMSLLFKVDQKDRLALILCTSLKVEMPHGIIPKSFLRHVDPHGREVKFRLAPKHVESEEKSKRQFNTRVNSMFRDHSASRSTLWRKDDRCVFCLAKSLVPGKHHLTYRQLLDLNTCYEQEGERKELEIPRVLARLHPSLTKGEYLAKVAQEEWLATRANVCANCWKQVQDFSPENYRKDPIVWRDRLRSTVGLIGLLPDRSAVSFDEYHCRSSKDLSQDRSRHLLSTSSHHYESASALKANVCGEYGQLLAELSIDAEKEVRTSAENQRPADQSTQSSRRSLQRYRKVAVRPASGDSRLSNKHSRLQLCKSFGTMRG